jgi:hypothetical protein
LWRYSVETAVVTDLRAKAEKYESKAAQCKASAQHAAKGPQRELYEVLAGYYSRLATDFRQVLARQAPAKGDVDPRTVRAS